MHAQLVKELEEAPHASEPEPGSLIASFRSIVSGIRVFVRQAFTLFS
jgi:hypothetical protein